MCKLRVLFTTKSNTLDFLRKSCAGDTPLDPIELKLINMYAVIRMEKRKGAAISAIEKHNNRTTEILPDGTEKQWAENADPNLTQDNISVKKYEDLNLNQSIHKHLNDLGITKTRKDAVKALEILCTASPEYFNGNAFDDKLTLFCEQANDFINERFGKKNVMSIDIHLDEKTPHIHFVVVPITKDKKLSAKTVCGNRKDYQKLQDDFSEKMKNLGLKRGIKGSNAKHIEMKEFYGLMNTNLSPVNEFLEKRKNEHENKYRDIAHKYRETANVALEFLANLNYKIDPKTNSIVELSPEEIEKRKKKKNRSMGL